MIRKTSAEDASGLAWFKNSYSSSEGDSCVEVATTTPTTIHIRDSKNPPSPSPSPHLTFPPATWTAFHSYAAVACGE